jgi:PAS domain S-box-containing protein
LGLTGKPRAGWRPYGVAVAAVAAASAATAAFWEGLGTRAPYLTFYPAVVLGAFCGGLRAGLLATGLSTIAALYWFEPAGRWTIRDGSDWAALSIFVVSCGAISWVCEARRRAQEMAAASAADAKVAFERQRAAETLQQTEERARFLADLIENAEQPVAVGYPDGRLGTFNRAFCELTGYTPAELRTLTWTDALTPAEWRAAERAALAELERTGKPVRYEKEYIRKDLTPVPIELLVHVARDASGKTQYYYSFLTDITERKRAGEELRRQREWLKVTLSSIGDAVIAVDTGGRITFLNPVAAELTGWSEEQALGRPVAEVFRMVNEQTRAPAEDIVARVLREARVVLLANHTALVSKDGRFATARGRSAES